MSGIFSQTSITTSVLSTFSSVNTEEVFAILQAFNSVNQDMHGSSCLDQINLKDIQFSSPRTSRTWTLTTALLWRTNRNSIVSSIICWYYRKLCSKRSISIQSSYWRSSDLKNLFKCRTYLSWQEHWTGILLRL